MVKLKQKIARKITSNNNDLTKHASIIFGVGLALALVSAFITVVFNVNNPTVSKVTAAVLIIIGLIIGILNITGDETISFLIASIVIVILIGPFLGNVMQVLELTPNGTGAKLIQELFKNIINLIVPAAIVVALKTLFATAKDE